MHSFETLADDIAAFLASNSLQSKNTGDTGGTGDISDKSLRPKANSATGQKESVSPIKMNRGHVFASNGDAKTQRVSIVSEFVPGVPGATGNLQEGIEENCAAVISSECYAIFEALKRCETPDWVSDDRWAELLSDAETFLATWGSSAERLGWTALDMFGGHPIAPAVRFDVMGLIPMLTGGEVIALTVAAATIRRPSGAILTYRRPEQGAVLWTEVKS